jgi:hypothetical protein
MMHHRGHYQHRAGAVRTSENAATAKFAEYPFYALR